jgi:hypothetical protein
MLRRITGFHQDQEQHWVADLECGHAQHVRHDPPLQTRTWVLAEEGRRSHLGTTLDCLCCDERVPADPRAAADPSLITYDDARLQGLCHDGAAEVSRVRTDP